MELGGGVITLDEIKNFIKISRLLPRTQFQLANTEKQASSNEMRHKLIVLY